MLNLKESIQNNVDTTNLLNAALENIVFMFRKVSEAELVIADQLKDMLRKMREALGRQVTRPIRSLSRCIVGTGRTAVRPEDLDEVSQDEMKSDVISLERNFH